MKNDNTFLTPLARAESTTKKYPANAKTEKITTADLTSLILPRAFAVEAGLHDSSVDFEKSRDEFSRARVHYDKLGLGDRVHFRVGDGRHGT